MKDLFSEQRLLVKGKEKIPNTARSFKARSSHHPALNPHTELNIEKMHAGSPNERKFVTR